MDGRKKRNSMKVCNRYYIGTSMFKHIAHGCEVASRFGSEVDSRLSMPPCIEVRMLHWRSACLASWSCVFSSIGGLLHELPPQSPSSTNLRNLHHPTCKALCASRHRSWLNKRSWKTKTSPLLVHHRILDCRVPAQLLALLIREANSLT